MLKLTKKADYGLIALRHIAVSPRGTSSAKEIADTYGIPLPLLAKVLQKLTKTNLTQSVAGTNGGYRLARDAAAISALEVDPRHRRPHHTDQLLYRARGVRPVRSMHRARAPCGKCTKPFWSCSTP